MRNQRTDFPVLACAVSSVNGNYRASIGARPAKAMLLRDEKGLLAQGITKESAKAFAQYVSENAPTASNTVPIAIPITVCSFLTNVKA